MKPRLLLLSLTAIALLAAPSLANAADYCVGAPSGCVGVNMGNDLQGALDAAKATTSTADRVFVGPAGSPYSRVDGFAYIEPLSANTVQIIGVGSPTVTMTTNTFLEYVLTLTQVGSSVSGLHVVVPLTATPVNAAGVLLGSGETADDLTVDGPSAPIDQNTGIQLGASTVRNSTINMSPQQGVGIYMTSNGAGVIRDNTVVGARAIDLAVGSGHTVTVRKNRLSAAYDGILMYYGDVDLDNTLIDLRGGSGVGILMDTVDATLDTNTIDASQLTIRNGDAGSIGVRQTNNDPNSTQTINLRDSIIWDVGHPIRQDTPAMNSTYTVTSLLDDYDPANNVPQAGSLVAGQVRSETSISVIDPGFLNPILGVNGLSGDYRLAFDSPLIDLDALALSAGEFDLRGFDRRVDGTAPFDGAKRDFGAYEYQRAAPVAAASASSGSATAGQAVGFDGSGSSDVDGEAMTYAWSFDDGATATGSSVSHAFATAGTHTGTLTVTDPTGLTGTASASVSVNTPPLVATATGQRSAALRKCKKIKNPVKRKKCKKRARKLPL